jgi:transposase
MAIPISVEKRAEIIKHMQAGKSKKDIAEWLFICVRTVTRVWNKFVSVGSYEPQPRNSGRKALVSEAEIKQVTEKIKEEPDITLLELIEEFNLKISQSALSRRLKKLGFTYKKRRSIQMGRSGKIL